jgi:hypothetical protein
MPAILCPNCCSTSEVKLKPQVIIVGFITFLCGLGDTVLNSYVSSAISNYQYGAWWSGMFVMVSGLLGTFACRRGAVIACCTVAIISISVAFAGLVIDGSGLVLLNTLETCVSTKNQFDLKAYDYSGNSAYKQDAQDCVELYYKESRDCYCVTATQSCYFFEGPTDCSIVLGSYTDYLSISVGLDLLCLLAAFSLAITACVSICCPFGFRRKKITKSITDDEKEETKAQERWGKLRATVLNKEVKPVAKGAKQVFDMENGAVRVRPASQINPIMANPMTQNSTFVNPMQGLNKSKSKTIEQREIEMQPRSISSDLDPLPATNDGSRLSSGSSRLSSDSTATDKAFSMANVTNPLERSRSQMSQAGSTILAGRGINRRSPTQGRGQGSEQPTTAKRPSTFSNIMRRLSGATLDVPAASEETGRESERGSESTPVDEEEGYGISQESFSEETNPSPHSRPSSPRPPRPPPPSSSNRPRSARSNDAPVSGGPPPPPPQR